MASSSSLLRGEATAMHRIKCYFCFFLDKNHCFSQQFRDVRLNSYRFLSIIYKPGNKFDSDIHKSTVQRPINVRSYQSSKSCLSKEISFSLDLDLDEDHLSYSYFNYYRKSIKLKPRKLSKLAVRSFSTGSKYAMFSDCTDPGHQTPSNGTKSNETDSTGGGQVKDKSILDSDPELRSIIEDIKRDFAKEKIQDTEPATPIPKKESEERHLTFEDNSRIRIDCSAEDEFEYDYSVAEDIEEYDYIDESEIGQHQMQPEKDIPISLERGKTGVFELEELLLLLDRLGAEDIVSFPVSPEARFCDHMVVVSAKSRRHLQAINEEILYIHKRKKSEQDTHLVVEGLDKSDWCAMDLGNIVLHVFYGKMREYYDIESLWTLGPDKDPKCQETDKDPYALSAEDLFWLEAVKSKGAPTACVTNPSTKGPHKDLSPPGQVSDREAGWGNTPHH